MAQNAIDQEFIDSIEADHFFDIVTDLILPRFEQMSLNQQKKVIRKVQLQLDGWITKNIRKNPSLKRTDSNTIS